MKPVLAILLPLLLAACASADTNVAETSAPSSALRCTREFPTGSNIAVTTCRSADDLRRESQAAQDAAEAIARSKSGYRGPVGQ